MGYIFDTFTNFLSGLGMAGRDKMTAHNYTRKLWTRPQLEASFQSDWIARKAITIPAMDSTRQWRAWQAEQPQIEKLEAAENKLGLQLKLQQALVKARLYGGSCMLIGVDGNMEKELDPETIERDALKFVHVFAPHQLSVEELERDIASPYYGQPKCYYLRDEGTTQIGKKPAFEVKIHPSRMVRLIGLESPDPFLNEGWGDPLMQMIDDAVSSAGTVTASVATLISEAKLDIIKIPGLTEVFATTAGTERLIKRFAEANVAKSVINGLVLDAEEEWQRIGVDFNGMPEILQMYLQIAAGAADIPVTRFLGMSPAGLNATGESDLTNYYDKIHSEQELRLTPALEKLDKALMRSALGKFDKNIYYEWNSLWQMSAPDKAALAKLKADTAAVDAATGLVPFEALVKGRVNQLIEDGTYPGLEAGIEEAIENMEEQAQLGPDGQPKMLPAPKPPDDYDNENEGGMDGEKEEDEEYADARPDFDEALHPRLHGQFTFSGGSTPKEKAQKATSAMRGASKKKRDQEELGPGYSKSAKLKNGVIHTSNVNDAVLALYQDRHVELAQPKQVSTLIRTLGEASKAMVEGGEVPPNYDLCKVSVKGTNLFCAENKGIPRVKMPQMDDDQTKEFIKHLKKLGFKSEKDVEKSANLRATQTQLDTAKVNKFFERIKKDPDFKGDDKRLVISEDDYVLDGHHHWAAQIAADTIDNKLGDHKTRVYRMNIPIIPLYKLAMKFTGGKGAKGQGDSLDGVWMSFGDGILYTLDEMVEVFGYEDAKGAWTEALHPRVTSGEHGGEFGSGGGGTTSVKEKSARAASALKKSSKGGKAKSHEVMTAAATKFGHTISKLGSTAKSVPLPGGQLLGWDLRGAPKVYWKDPKYASLQSYQVTTKEALELLKEHAPDDYESKDDTEYEVEKPDEQPAFIRERIKATKYEPDRIVPDEDDTVITEVEHKGQTYEVHTTESKRDKMLDEYAQVYRKLKNGKIQRITTTMRVYEVVKLAQAKQQPLPSPEPEKKPELKPLSKEEHARYQDLEERFEKLTPEEKEEFNQLGERFDAEWDRKLQEKTKAESEAAELRRHEAFKETINKVCDDLGFDASRVDLSKGEHEFELNGKKRKAGGYCEINKGEKGRIVLFSEQIPGEKSLSGVLAHEIEHAKFAFANDAFRAEQKLVSADPGPEPDPTAESYHARRGGYIAMMTGQGQLREPYASKYPTYHAMAQSVVKVSADDFAAGDGVSGYSAEYWLAWHRGTVSTELAMHETLAEMARIKYQTGKFPDHYGFSRIIRERTEARPPPSGEEFTPVQKNKAKGQTIWRDLYRTVDKIYKEGHK